MFAFHFNRETGAYMGSSPIEFSPLEPGVKLVPAWATDIPPPPVGEGECAYFNPGANKWTVARSLPQAQ